ncbi:PQQ-dependent sugar dehydrogenase [Eisenibacter elegans]|uniref:PQQ-dependent sugar dehydrogenase n=1 Tax=Eisenibacter elegans TaxID=997 RepID=UPI0003FBA818|nr:PQQ-dependent sugar dehydrogenase [Eisenibacter elegans]
MKKSLIASLMYCTLGLATVCWQCRSSDDPQPQLDWTLKVDTLLTNLQNPWGAAFLPTGALLITERAGNLLLWNPNTGGTPQPISGLPSDIYVQGQGGLLDIQLHPQYTQNGWIYFVAARRTSSQGGNTAIYRTKLQGTQLQDTQVLFQGVPSSTAGQHFGARLTFDDQGFIYMGIGDRGTPQQSQSINNHIGTIVRLHDDGRIPSNNPFVQTPNAQPEIWSYGHRNPQGLFFDTTRRILWAHEHGPQGGDELNRIERGGNYGWPEVTFGINYNGTTISEETEREGMVSPIIHWSPAIAPCGLLIVKGDRYPGWQGDALLGSLVARHLRYLKLNAQGKIQSQERLLDGIGRVRWVGQAPDGLIYVLTETPGMLLKISPQ